MAQIKNGVLGGFSGKAGSVIGYIVRGKSYIRGLSNKKPKKPTIKQLASRARFKMLQEWRSRYTTFFATTFKNHTHERSAQNAAHALNAHIIKGEYPNFEIDPTEIVISSGTLPGLADLTMHLDDQLQLNFNWDMIYEKGEQHLDVLALLVQYEDKAKFFEATTTAAIRADKQLIYKLKFPNGKSSAHVYVTVLSDDRERAATSRYMGRIEF